MGGMPGEYDVRPKAPEGKGNSAINRLDEELTILERAIELLRERLGPVLSRYDTVASIASPMTEAASELGERSDRVRQLRTRIDRIIEDLDI